MIENKMLKDDELEKVSGGQLATHWKEVIDEYAEDYKRKEIDFADFKKEVLNGNDIRLLICDGDTFNCAEITEITEYLESISW